MILTPPPAVGVADSSHDLQQTAPSRPHPRGLGSGRILDGFRIDHQLGQGGMGVVYAAWDLRNDRPAAVKVLGESVGDRRLFERFQREAATVARLHHTGIVELFQLGQTADVCYMAMERVDGVTLRKWMDITAAGVSPLIGSDILTPVLPVRFDGRYPFPELGPEDSADGLAPRRSVRPTDPARLRQLTELLRELADAVAHAHAAGVTHRDLKPENVMVRNDGRIVVIDFGLARSFADTTLTTHSGLIGTPMYMSPEQLKGRPAGPASDVFALGLIGYELFSGSLPYLARTVEGLLGEVLNKSAPPLTLRNPAITPALANVLHKALAKDVEARYPSAVELRNDLDRVLAMQSVRAPKYRYRFNPRDVRADRPQQVALAAYANLAVGGMLGLASLVMFPHVLLSAVVILILAAVFTAAGVRLLLAARGARILGGVAVVQAIGCWFMVLCGPQRDNQFAWYVPLVIGLAFGGLVVGTSTAIFSRAARKWFRRMHEERLIFERDSRG